MTIDVTVGGAYSNSFITLAEALTFIVHLPDGENVWTPLTDEEKEYRLRLAADIMGHLRLKGSRVYKHQRLPFPRTHQIDVTSIPFEVKEAQAFIAISVIHRGIAGRPASPNTREATRDINQLTLGGALHVNFGSTKAKPIDVLSQAVQSAQFPALVGLRNHLTQVRQILPHDQELLESPTETA